MGMSGLVLPAITSWRGSLGRAVRPILLVLLGMGVSGVGLAGCGGKSAKGSSTGAKKKAPPVDAGRVLVKAISVVWALETIDETADEPARTRVSIAITNEVGATRYEVIGVFDGGCKDIGAETNNPDVLLALECKQAKRGAVLHGVKRQSGLVFLRAFIYAGESELSFDVMKTFPLPAGAVVEVGTNANEQ